MTNKQRTKKALERSHRANLSLLDWYGRSYYWFKLFSCLSSVFWFHVTQDSYWLMIAYQLFLSVPAYNDYGHRIYITKMKDWFLRRIG